MDKDYGSAAHAEHGNGHGNGHTSRRLPGDLEVGATDVLQRHPTAHLVQEHAVPVPAWVLRLEAKRPLWLREMVAEAFGVFCYVYCGSAAQATLTFSVVRNELYLGNLFVVGLAFGFGISFAIITSAVTSGGHFNPAITIMFAIFQGFPWRKVPRYLFAQIFGGFLATFFVYGQYRETFQAFENAFNSIGGDLTGPQGPASILVAIPAAGQSMRYLFITEFLTDSFLAVVIWSVLDPSNFFVSPASAPFIIGLAYAVMIWGFGSNTLSTNLARDLGARMAAACLYGKGVFTTPAFPGYAALASLANIPATFVGVLFVTLNMRQTHKIIEQGHAIHPEVHEVLQAERARSSSTGVRETNGQIMRRLTQSEPNRRDTGNESRGMVEAGIGGNFA